MYNVLDTAGGCQLPCVLAASLQDCNHHGHPLLGSQVEPLHEGPGPLSCCGYSCRMSLTMESPTAAASSPGSRSSSPSRGRAAAEPSTIDNTMTTTSMITAGSTRFLFISTAAMESRQTLYNVQDVGLYAKLWLKEPLYIGNNRRKRERERHAGKGAMRCPPEVAYSLRGTTRQNDI